MSAPAADSKTSEIVYPKSDGEPLGETGWHVHVTLHIYAALRQHFARRDDIYVAADMFLYYEEGAPSQVEAPDVMVIFGVPKHERGTFKVWEERAVPSVIFEITSPSSFREDVYRKSELYARLGVTEFYIFDPLNECFDRPFFAYRLNQGGYQAVPLGEDGGLDSPLLGVRLRPEESLLRGIDLATNQPILTFHEQGLAIEAEHPRAEAERQRAEAEQQRPETEWQRADAESQRAETLAAENQRLRALLESQQKNGGSSPKQ